MAEISENDFNVLWRISSLYEALTLSALDPIVLHHGLEDENEPEGMYYDCYENETKALTIMRKRISNASNDLKRHQEIHKACLNYFYTIDESINTSNRQIVSNAANNLCEQVLEYLTLVQEHQIIQKGESFLYYPSCPAGHYFYIPNSDMRITHQLRFNPLRSMKGAEKDIRKIKDGIQDFSLNTKRVHPMKISSQSDSGEGIIDTSLRARIELNQELLKRAGFSLE